jgi:hypothetical protein
MTWGVWRKASGFGSQIGGVINVPDDAPAAYEGPGDIVGSAYFWGGLRAYSEATIGDNAVRIRRSSDDTEQDFITLADGSLDVASIATFIGGGSGFVRTLYDQSGNGRDIGNATSATQPELILSGVGSLPVMRFTYATAQFLRNAAVTGRSQPYSHSIVAKRTSDFTGYHGLLGDSTNGSGYANSADTFLMFAGNLPTATATDGAWHTLQAAYDGASSVAYVDGASSSEDPGTTGLSTVLAMGQLSGSPLGADVAEAGEWGIKFNGTQAGDLDTNQAAYWGI